MSLCSYSDKLALIKCMQTHTRTHPHTHTHTHACARAHTHTHVHWPVCSLTCVFSDLCVRWPVCSLCSHVLTCTLVHTCTVPHDRISLCWPVCLFTDLYPCVDLNRWGPRGQHPVPVGARGRSQCPGAVPAHTSLQGRLCRAHGGRAGEAADWALTGGSETNWAEKFKWSFDLMWNSCVGLS